MTDENGDSRPLGLRVSRRQMLSYSAVAGAAVGTGALRVAGAAANARGQHRCAQRD